jgi:hypothetical protein
MITSRPEENFYGGYDYSVGNLGISLLFPEIEGYGLRNQSLNLSRIVMVNSDSIDESLPSKWLQPCRQPADELSDWSSRALNTLFGLSNENVGDMGPIIQAVITLRKGKM